MGKALETWNLPKLNYREVESLNRTKMSTDNESYFKNLPTQKRLGPDDFTGEFPQHLKN